MTFETPYPAEGKANEMLVHCNGLFMLGGFDLNWSNDYEHASTGSNKNRIEK
jgi:hypothetical protein